MIVGIDSSLTSTGLAIIRDDYRKLYNILTKSGQFKTKEERTRYIALEVMRRVKDEWINNEEILWGIEDYAMSRRMGRGLDLAEVGCLIKQTMWGFTKNLPIKVNPKTLKKFICGRGNVEKNQHLLYAFTKWDFKFPNDDVCDAFALAKLVEATLTKNKEDLYKYEVDCCKAVIKYNELEAEEWAKKFIS